VSQLHQGGIMAIPIAYTRNCSWQQPARQPAGPGRPWPRGESPPPSHALAGHAGWLLRIAPSLQDSTHVQSTETKMAGAS